MKDEHVGFSGSRNGLTIEQITTIDKLLAYNLTTMIARHGDCVGADAEFHKLARLNGLYIIGHPPIKNGKRAYCDFDEEMVPEEYLDRNRTIVDSSDWMIFGPETFEEVIRSGTWSTVRYTREQKKKGCIVWPDGKSTELE